MSFRWRKSDPPPDDPPPVDPSLGEGDVASLLDADQPIAAIEEDRLGRTQFATRLARQIELAPRSGFVVALAGPWGSGKTSVLRMVERRLTESQPLANPARIVVSFNPWLVSGSEQLVSQFVGELAGALPKVLGASRGTRAATRLQHYAQGLQTLERAPGIGWAFQLFGALMSEAGRRVDDSPDTLLETRKQARDALEDLDVHVVVLVDDVDRLQDVEIRELMRMIKLVGDFPNVTYLLAFDRKVVQSALDTQGTDGGEYLEKIVQIEYRLPEPPPEMLEALLLDGINRAIQDVPQHRLDRPRWEAVYAGIVHPLISRPRHVRRFANALPLAVDLAGEEVDIVDVVALTALQTLLPEFHDRLLDLREDLVPSARHLALWDRQDDATQATAKRLNQMADEAKDPAVARAAYQLLFPATSAVLSNTHNDDQLEWRAKRRVADREAFDTYFTATLPQGVLPVAKVRQAVEAFATGPEALAEVFEAQPTDLLPALFHRIWGHIDDVELGDIKRGLEAVADAVRRLPDLSSGFGTPADQGRAFIRDLVRRFPEGDQRDAVAWHRFDISRSLTEKFMWLRSMGAWEDSRDSFCSPDLIGSLRLELAEQVLSARIETLLEEEHTGWLLRTAEKDRGEGASERVAALLADGRLIPEYLGSFLVLTGFGDHRLDVSELEQRQGRASLEAALKLVDEASTTEEERSLLRQLREHYETCDENKPLS
jgi:KAP family P-loop domain